MHVYVDTTFRASELVVILTMIVERDPQFFYRESVLLLKFLMAQG
jgi:hypothetical protein